MQTINREDGLRYVRFESEAGELSAEVTLSPGPFTATVTLPGGATVLVEGSTSAPSIVAAGLANYAPFLGLGAAGVVSESSCFDTAGSHTALRLTASAPGVIVEVLQ